MFQDRKGRFWLGTWGQGYLVWDEKTGDMRRFFYPGADQTLVQQNLVAYIFEASDGTIWVSTYRGVFRISVEESQPVFAKKFKFENLDDLGLGEDYVGMMGEDHLGNIWLTTLRRGLYCFHPTTRQIRRFQHDPDDPKTLGSRHISAIFEDREQRLWIGTTAGLQLFQPASGQFVQFREKDGLPSDAVRGITEDARGFLWLTTRRGLSKFDPEHRTFLNYFKEDGLPCEEFATRSLGTCRRSGEIFAGGSEGFVLFHPDSIRSSNFVPPVAIAGLKKHVVAGGQIMAVSVPGISALDHIALPFSENTLTFEFAALDFQQVFKNQYAYRLLGISDHWAPLGAKQDVTFSNLPPGHYVLEVKASNAEGQWNEQGVRLNIDILPPWWSTWWACTAYGLVSGGILLAFFQLRHRRNRDKAKADRLHDLNEAKNQFLSTVSHELRTPLSSVMGFSKIIKKRLEERILPQTDMSDPKTERAAVQVMSNLDIVIGESERLTTLINEVLDLAKIESGLVIWHEERLNLAQLLERAVATTATLFEQKNLTLLKNIAPELPDPLGDPDRLLQVLVNLLSNAVKFTEQGTVTVSAWPQPDHTLVVGVADTGIGIPEGFRHLVFEKFRQVADDVLTDKPQGTGLGLSICREIVEHHGGRIWLESEVGRGSTFWFTLPLR